MPAKPKPSSNRGLWTIAIVFGGLFLIFIVFVAMLLGTMTPGRLGDNQIGVIEITGPINSADKTLANIQAFKEQKEIQGILIRIDSPGGSVGASQEIFEAVQNLDKPVVVSMGNVAASGGFYIAMAGPKIFSNPGTITGSIGVITQTLEADALMDYLQLKMNTVTSGVLKDSGSPFRDFTEADRKHYETIVVDIYEQFVEAVADARDMKKKEVIPYADGRIFTGRQALEYGFVDELGGMQAAIDWMAEDLEMSGEPTLVYPKPDTEGLLGMLMSEGVSAVNSQLGAATTPSFEYRYAGPMAQ